MPATLPVESPRQMTFFSKITEVIPHIEFSCLVKGRKLTASLNHLEDTGTATLYHVSFSDGHTDAYLPSDAEGHGGNGQKGPHDAYEEAISSDLYLIATIIKTHKAGITTFRVYGEGGENFNVWLCEQRGNYRVYYKGAYHFTLRKRNLWEVSTKREKGYRINQELASLISNHLDSRLH